MAEKILNVVTICGSLRKKSYNRALMRALPSLAPASMKLIDAPPFDPAPLYSQDIQDSSGFPPIMEDLAAAVRNADGVLFVTPEYNWSIPGGLKNALDWMSRMKDQPFREKPVAIQSASQGPLGGGRMQYHLRMSLTFLSAFVFGTPEVFVGMAPNKFDKDTLALTDQPTRDIIKKQLEAFAAFIERMRPKA